MHDSRGTHPAIAILARKLLRGILLLLLSFWSSAAASAALLLSAPDPLRLLSSMPPSAPEEESLLPCRLGACPSRPSGGVPQPSTLLLLFEPAADAVRPALLPPPPFMRMARPAGAPSSDACAAGSAASKSGRGSSGSARMRSARAAMSSCAGAANALFATAPAGCCCCMGPHSPAGCSSSELLTASSRQPVRSSLQGQMGASEKALPLALY